jgi:hypothetical protein
MGPYIVVRQTGPSNYLVKRQGEEATFEVHVSALKPYVARLPDQPEISEEDSEEAKENEEEPDNPVTEPVAEQPPPCTSLTLPIDTEIQDHPQIIQKTQTTHNEQTPLSEKQTNRPKRKKKPPQRFLTLIPLIILSVCTSPSAQVEPNTVIERGGVYFRHLAQVAMGDSAWTVVTDINLNQIDDFIAQVTNELSHGNKVPPPPIDSELLNRRLDLGLASNNERLQTITKRFSILRNAILGQDNGRSRRAVFDGVGQAMNWLFGVTTVKQFTTLNAKFEKLTEHTGTVTHLLQQHASLINESLWETRTTATKLLNISATIDHLQQRQREFRDEVHVRFAHIMHVADSLEALATAVNWIEQYVDDFGIALTSLAQGKLPPSMFPPDTLQRVISKISRVLPNGWTLTASTKAGELWHFYEEAKVATASTATGLRLFIQFPVVETRSNFDLFQIISIPQPIGNGSLARKLSPLPPYIAISENRQLYAELQTNEIGQCLTPAPSLCRLFVALSHRLSKRTCSMAVFNADTKLIASDCIITTESWSGPDMKYIGNNKWAYTTTPNQQIHFTCASNKANDIKTLTTTGVIELPDGCTATADHWILPANIRHHSEQEETPTATTHPFTFLDLPFETTATEKTPFNAQPPQIDLEITELLKRNAAEIENTKTVFNTTAQLETKIKEIEMNVWTTVESTVVSVSLVWHMATSILLLLFYRHLTTQGTIHKANAHQLTLIQAWLQQHDQIDLQSKDSTHIEQLQTEN